MAQRLLSIKKLSPALAKVLNTDRASHQKALQGVWSYIRANNLLDQVQKGVVHCDPALEAVFHKPTITPADVLSGLKSHIIGDTGDKETVTKKGNKKPDERNEAVYKLSPQLSQVVGTDTGTRGAVLKRFWAYAKSKGLVTNGVISPNSEISAIFPNKPALSSPDVMMGLSPHLVSKISGKVEKREAKY